MTDEPSLIEFVKNRQNECYQESIIREKNNDKEGAIYYYGIAGELEKVLQFLKENTIPAIDNELAEHHKDAIKGEQYWRGYNTGLVTIRNDILGADKLEEKK